ncbi:MAG: response regulator [Candidatus Thermoplasmatota archaeon]|nr:response regulator [Candidatus Thermoplasmatota archaeon]
MMEKIMFVDDDPSILDAAKTAIESYGYKVITAKSGEECLEKLEDASLVFLDIKMPGMDGIEVLKRIKKKIASIPVIMITAYATIDTAIEAMKQGAFDYIRKPFDVEELEGSILAALEEIKFDELKKLNFEGDDYFKKFEELIKDRKGICITKDLDRIKGMDNVRPISLVKDWYPRDIEDIKKELSELFEYNTVILLTNIEYLLEKNSTDEARNFLKWLYRMSSTNRGTLILSTDFKNVDNKMANEISDIIADIRLGLFSESISNYLRRKVIQLLSDSEKYSFTKIAQMLNIKDNPKLSFHLKKLRDDGVIEQDEDKRYFLSRVGKDIADVLDSVKNRRVKNKTDLLWMPKGK